MGKTKLICFMVLFVCCKHRNSLTTERRVTIGNWRYSLLLHDNGFSKDMLDSVVYLKASLQIGNIKTQRSLLYSASMNQQDYKDNYNYLSFYANRDLYIKYSDSIIYPLGYVFEPSNGLTPDERLVYKFVLTKRQYLNLTQENSDAAFWYHDRISKLGKICLR